MKEALEFLQKSGVFHVATIDGNQPRVRPFSFVMEYEGKLSFCTGNKKPFWEQLTKNPNVEISACSGDKWIRISGKAVSIDDRAAKEKALEVEPMLKRMYSPDDSIFQIFYLENAVAEYYSFSGERKTVKL